MNLLVREKRFCTALFLLFLFIGGLIPAFADDYGQPASHLPPQELENDELNQPSQQPGQPPANTGQQHPNPNQPKHQTGQQSQGSKQPSHMPNQPTQKPDLNNQMQGQKGQELGKKDQELNQKGKKGHKLGKKDKELNQKDKKGQELGKKDKELNQKGKKGQELGKKDKELNQKDKKGQELGKKDKELNQKDKKGQELGKKDKELNQKDKKGQELGKKDQELKPKAGDIALQIANETDFALSVRASLVDASERVNLTKAKSANLAAHSREMVALSPMNTGKVSLAPASAKAEVSKDSKILLTINRGKESRRLVLGYAKSAGTIVLGKDLFPDGQEKQKQPKPPTSHNEELENNQQKPVSSSNAQTVYVINQTGTPLTFDAILKPTSFDPLQGELKPGTNALKFSSKKAARTISKEKIGLTIQMKYNLPGSPAVTFKKEALDLESNPTVVINKTIMGEPVDQASSMKKPK